MRVSRSPVIERRTKSCWSMIRWCDQPWLPVIALKDAAADATVDVPASRRNRSTSLVGRWIRPWAMSAAPPATANPALCGEAEEQSGGLDLKRRERAGRHLCRCVVADSVDQRLPSASQLSRDDQVRPQVHQQRAVDVVADVLSRALAEDDFRVLSPAGAGRIGRKPGRAQTSSGAVAGGRGAAPVRPAAGARRQERRPRGHGPRAPRGSQDGERAQVRSCRPDDPLGGGEVRALGSGGVGGECRPGGASSARQFRARQAGQPPGPLQQIRGRRHSVLPSIPSAYATSVSDRIQGWLALSPLADNDEPRWGCAPDRYSPGTRRSLT